MTCQVNTVSNKVRVSDYKTCALRISELELNSSCTAFTIKKPVQSAEQASSSTWGPEQGI